MYGKADELGHFLEVMNNVVLVLNHAYGACWS